MTVRSCHEMTRVGRSNPCASSAIQDARLYPPEKPPEGLPTKLGHPTCSTVPGMLLGKHGMLPGKHPRNVPSERANLRRERGGGSGRARGGDERESPRAPAASMTSRCGEGRWRCRAVSDATGCREPLSLSERFQKGAAFAASALAHGGAVRAAAIFSQSDGGSGGAAARGERRRAA